MRPATAVGVGDGERTCWGDISGEEGPLAGEGGEETVLWKLVCVSTWDRSCTGWGRGRLEGRGVAEADPDTHQPGSVS
ncbi:hypothetical protein Pmani_033714 [Petrolisthes manimaculis]|uniref:Uncharacterized protein n=1 Tax=Petrolisthes manimaculis TaxID=1843537 RepID=A0AAE1NNU2_9EUCA|nr:hypothetical protein Pmani_033714 [Petrolisthes manimaculis]